ncbi:hypothetical protein BDZ45DRAFT_801555 [Acephala macrosclerotiorum]|nr:hypothetical protein BDZ45DRAFT_801555 [Acephala macrosclerotiorum]
MATVWSTSGGYMHLSGKLPISPSCLGVSASEQDANYNSFDEHKYTTPHESGQQLDGHSNIKTETNPRAVPDPPTPPKPSEENKASAPQMASTQPLIKKKPSTEFEKIGKVKGLLEYFFSLQNLRRDWPLRKHMNFGGFVRLSFVASLTSLRLANLTSIRRTSLEVLHTCCLESDILELVELSQFENERYAVRLKEDWKRWVPPEAERDESVRWNDAARRYYRPGTEAGKSNKSLA